MKAINCTDCRRKIAKECKEEYLKQQYAIYKDLAHTFACFCTAAVLMAHIRKGRSKAYIQKLFEELVLIFDTPQLFGKDILLTDVLKRLEQDYGLDFKRLHVHIETEKEFVKGGRV